MSYRKNIITKQFVKDDGNLGDDFYQSDWVEVSSKEAKQYELDNLKSITIQKIKNEASCKITKRYSNFNQCNILMSQNVEEIVQMNNFIQGVRDKSNLLESSLDGMDLTNLQLFDAANADNWK